MTPGAPVPGGGAPLVAGSRWTAWIGGGLIVVAAVALAVALVGGDRTRQRPGLEPGTRLPPFAAPLLVGAIDGDVNVAVRRNQGSAGRTPACAVRGPGVLNWCTAARGRRSVVAFLAPVGDCLDTLTTLQRFADAGASRSNWPAVAAVIVRGNRDRLRAALRERRITIPVGWDRDGVLSSVYNVVVCPQVTVADGAGRVRSTIYGALSTAALKAQVAAAQ